MFVGYLNAILTLIIFCIEINYILIEFGQKEFHERYISTNTSQMKACLSIIIFSVNTNFIWFEYCSIYVQVTINPVKLTCEVSSFNLSLDGLQLHLEDERGVAGNLRGRAALAVAELGRDG